jgi:quercetin dioxygenase-like cupin family protein
MTTFSDWWDAHGIRERHRTHREVAESAWRGARAGNDHLRTMLEVWLSGRPIIVPERVPVAIDGNLSALVLYRTGAFQVQLFIVAPGTVVPEHCHPDVDSFEVYLGGDIAFTLDGEPCNEHVIRVTPQTWHGARVGERGGAFLSVQHWLNGRTPSTVADSWRARDDTRRNYAAT